MNHQAGCTHRTKHVVDSAWWPSPINSGQSDRSFGWPAGAQASSSCDPKAMKTQRPPGSRRFILLPHHDPGRHPPKAAHETQRRHQTQPVPGQVDLPPAKTLAAGSRKEMMIVVPALAEREQRQPYVIAAVIVSVEAAST